MTEFQTPPDPVTQRFFTEALDRLHRRTDLLFGALIVVQLLGACAAALWLAPNTWSGPNSRIHLHVWLGVALAVVLASFPLALIVARRGRPVTRYTIAVSQMMFSALLIHLSGGRIETHFHVFVSLAFLAFYRDWRLLVPATIVVASDHFARAMFWPQSVFGVLSASPWRALEHAAWVSFEVAVLGVSCVQARREMIRAARAGAAQVRSNQLIEQQVEARTRELREQAEQLAVSEERLRLAIMVSRDGVWDWDLTTDKVYYAPRWKEMLGYADRDFGDSPDAWLSQIASEHLAEFDAELSRLTSGEVARLDAEFLMFHASGRALWVHCLATSIKDPDGRVVRLAGSMADITELKETQEQLEQLAHNDSLTGLPNRSALARRIEMEIARAERKPDYAFAVLFGDFDRFKVVNDSLGHSAGDKLLASIADRFLDVLRAGDFAARFGGDEFVVVLSNAQSTETVEGAAQRFVDAFDQPHQICGQEIISTVSLGVVVVQGKRASVEEILRDADAAMYQAKLAGKGCYRVFDESMHADAVRRIDTEQLLRAATQSPDAMDANFRLVYQPIVDLADGRLAGFEALVRWSGSGGKPVGPDVFIPIMEETGLILPLGEWTIRKACEQAVRWRARVGPDAPMRIHANLSRRQLLQPDLVPAIKRALESTGADPDDIELELTETALMDDRIDAVSILNDILATGVRLAMDDFGTGHSSLGCLRQFPLHTLKIDRAFLRNLTRERESSAVLHAIVALAENLNLAVVAEGIEHAEQLAQLQAMNCNYAQGYFFSRPLEVEDVDRLLVPGYSFARPPECRPDVPASGANAA